MSFPVPHPQLCTELRDLAKEFLYVSETKLRNRIFELYAGKNTSSYVTQVQSYQQEIIEDIQSGEADESDEDSIRKIPGDEYMDAMMRTLNEKNCKVEFLPSDYYNFDRCLELIIGIYKLAHFYRRRPYDGLRGIMIMGPPGAGKSTLLRSLDGYVVPHNTLGVSRFATKKINMILEDWKIADLEKVENQCILRQISMGQYTTDKISGNTYDVNPKWLWMTTNDTMKEFSNLPPEGQRRWIVIRLSNRDAAAEDSHLENYDRKEFLHICKENFVDCSRNVYFEEQDKSSNDVTRLRERPIMYLKNYHNRVLRMNKDQTHRHVPYTMLYSDGMHAKSLHDNMMAEERNARLNEIVEGVKTVVHKSKR